MAVDFDQQTLGDLVDETKVLLKQKFRDHLNRLKAGIDDSATTLELVENTQGMRAGDLIELSSELMYVWHVDVAAQDLLVERGWMGTTPTAHSTGAIVTVEPRWTRQQIVDTMRTELLSWEKSLVYAHTRVQAALNGTGGSTFIELPDLTEAGKIEPVRILQLDVEPDAQRTDQTWKRHNGGELLRDLPATWSVSGWGLRLRFLRPVGRERNYYLTYAHDYDYSEWEESTLLDTLRLPRDQRDIPAYGVAWRIIEGTEVARTDAHAQAQTRVTEDVPPTYRTSTADIFRRRREERLSEVAQNLMIRFPQVWR